MGDRGTFMSHSMCVMCGLVYVWTRVCLCRGLCTYLYTWARILKIETIGCPMKGFGQTYLWHPSLSFWHLFVCICDNRGICHYFTDSPMYTLYKWITSSICDISALYEPFICPFRGNITFSRGICDICSYLALFHLKRARMTYIPSRCHINGLQYHKPTYQWRILLLSHTWMPLAGELSLAKITTPFYTTLCILTHNLSLPVTEISPHPVLRSPRWPVSTMSHHSIVPKASTPEWRYIDWGRWL